MDDALIQELRSLFEAAHEIEAKILNLINAIKEKEREQLADDEKDSPL